VYGGYPKVVLAEDDDMRKILLEELGASYIKKEAKEAGIKNTGKYFSLLKILAEQIGSLVNSQGLANTLKIAHKTIDEYFYVMKKSYQVAFIRPFYRSLRKELTKMPKVYFYDTGLRNFFVDDFNLLGRRRDKGAFLENIAFRELSIQAGSPEKIKFWRTQDKNEVDFIAGGEAFEIKFDQGRLRRNNYREFTSRYPDIKLTFLTYKDILERFYGYRIV
jgi:predicted AAA+ superfamily ATPase